MAGENEDDDDGTWAQISIPDVYATLGVTREASEDEIERAARLWLTEAQAFGATQEEVEAVLGAYAVLSDPLRRALYDALLSALQLLVWISERWSEASRPQRSGGPAESDPPAGPSPSSAAPSGAATRPPRTEPPPPIDWSVLRPTRPPVGTDRPDPAEVRRSPPRTAPAPTAIVPATLPPVAGSRYSYTRRELTRAVEVFAAVPAQVEATRHHLTRHPVATVGSPNALADRPRPRQSGRGASPTRSTRASGPTPRQPARWRGTLLALCALGALLVGVPRLVDAASDREVVVVGDAPRRLVGAAPCTPPGDELAAATLGIDGDRWVAETGLVEPDGDGPTEVTVALTGASAVVDANGDDVTVRATVDWRRSVAIEVVEPEGVAAEVVDARVDFVEGYLRLSWPTDLHRDPDGHRWRAEWRADGITTTCRAIDAIR